MEQLSGLAGCKKMAQDIFRAEREAARDAYVNGGKKVTHRSRGLTCAEVVFGMQLHGQ